MNDLEYDALQKKRIARSASAKKGGSKSKKCTLPSDWLTESQRKKLNGEVMTYQIRKPITWDEFRNYPQHAQKMYLEHFATEHQTTVSMLEDMFGCKRNNLYSYIKKRPTLHGILPMRTPIDAKKRFFEWLETERTGGAEEPAQTAADTVMEESEEKVVEKVAEKPVSKFDNCVKNGRFVVKGTPNEIGVALLNIFQDHYLSATIHFEVIE